MTDCFKTKALRYGLAVVSVVLATWLRELADPLLADRLPFLTFFIAVVITASFGGFGPALLAVILSSLAAAHFFIAPDVSLFPDHVAGWIGLVLFFCFGIGAACLCGWLRRRTSLLDQERTQFFVTLASIGDGVIVTDENAKIIFMNSVAETLTGWQHSEARGKPIERVFHIVHEETRQPEESPVGRAIRLATAVSLSNHTILITKDGSDLAVDDSAAPIHDPTGRIRGVVLVFRDVTEKRALQVERGRLAALVDSSEDAILVQTFDGTIIDWNAGAEHLFGYTAEEVVGRQIFEFLVPAEHKQQLLDALQLVEQAQQADHFEAIRLHKDGRRIPVSVRVSPIRNAEGHVVAASAIDRDMSQQWAVGRRRSARLSVNQILTGSTTIDSAVPQILEAICGALDWSIGCFWRVDESGQSIRCANFWKHVNVPSSEFEQTARGIVLSRGECLPGLVWHQRRPQWMPDVSDNPQFHRARAAREVGIHGAFGCPITVGNDVLGVIEFFSDEIRDPDDDLLEMMTTIGSQLGQFIERQRAVEDLRRRERELADFFNNATIGLHWLGRDGTVQRVNQAELDMLGYTREEYVGQHISRFYVDGGEISAMLQRLAAGEEIRDREVQLRCKDGSIRHALIDSNVLWEDGHFIHSRWFTRDITDRKRVEQSLSESEEQFGVLANSIPQLAWMAQPNGRIFWYNQRWYEYTGTTLEEMQGRGWRGVHDPKELPRIVQKWKQAVASGEPWEDTFPLRRHDGEMRWHLSRAVPVRNEHGEIVRWFGTNTDITERTKMEKALKEADRRKDEFLAMLAHELRNPLAPIRSGLDVLALEDGNNRETIELMQEQVTHVVRLVDDLLDVSRIMRGRVELRTEPVLLETLVRRSAEAVRPQIESQQQQLNLSLPKEPVWLTADPVRLIQVIENLLNNASKYTDRSGTIDLSATVDDSGVVIVVRDSGIGIDADLLPKIFDLFTQSSRSLDRSQGGLGIGLTLVKNLVEMHGGTVSVQSEGTGRGSSFTVRLPATAPAPKRATNAAPQGPCTRRRILVVDDNVGATMLLSRLLQKLGDHHVLTAHDGHAAVATALEEQPDIVLLDIGLPGMDGYEAGRTLRAHPDFDRVLLVALTGYGQEEDRRKSREAGFDEHLVKPPSIDQMKKLLAHPKLVHNHV